MECFMKANKVSNYNMRMLRENIRIPFTLIVVVLYVMESLFAVLAFSRSVHIDVTPFAFVFVVKQYRIILLSSNQAGPNDNDIEDYFNSYFSKDSEFKIRLRPIMRNIALEQIRNAQEARSITISLNIGRPLNDFLIDHTQEDRSVQGHLKALMELSKTSLDSNTFTLTLGLGRKKNSTLDIGALVELLDSINLDAHCIKEITVNYRNSPEEKLDVAKLRESNAILKIFFPIEGTQLGAEYILNNMDEILRNERQKYYQQVEEHFSNVVDIGENYEINVFWHEEPVV